jgi:phosphoribosylformylglycinamidine synthase
MVTPPEASYSLGIARFQRIPPHIKNYTRSNMVKRIYSEKKPAYAVRAKELKNEITEYLGIDTVESVRVLIRYDIENLSDETYKKSLGTVFSEPPVDFLYEGDFPKASDEVYFSVEYLPGQFDQRADSAVQCVKLLCESEEPVILSATTYVLKGKVTSEELDKIRKYCINPVDSRTASEELPETLQINYETPADIKIFDGFREIAEEELKKLYDSLNLAMTFRDFLFIRDYYKNEEKRDPSFTEIRVFDTYWSDHCRHTTFLTELTEVEFEEGKYTAPIKASYEKYLKARSVLYADRPDKYVSLMDLAIFGMKELRAAGKLDDMEVSDEINACSVIVPVEVDGKTEEWLVFFKNETHNHPTEIEPFGGAATCLGGAIRDPLSGRGYVYQAMRVTGAADPRKPIAETLPGKLPQRKIVTGAANGYSSYGNQIGLATGLVDEIYHPNYVAKRLEIGAVMGAAKRENVIRENSEPGDVIILMGGRTGRDGCGGATGSSKAHNADSINTCGAEVQKGNAPTERKLQRLFRRPEVTKLIKKCNDFGAGGVSVAIGELADGLTVDLDLVPKKYAGLDGTELAISESQERMAIVVDKKDADKMLEFAASENLEAVVVAKVTEEKRLVLKWRGKDIVNISRDFLNTNGAHQEAKAFVEMPEEKKEEKEESDLKKKWLDTLSDLNVCSKKGLSEMFDSSIGASSTLMPFGGKYQMTPTQTMVAKLPVLRGKCDTVTMMSYGFDPYLSSRSPYHGASYAVISSVAKIVAAGGDLTSIRFTFQEFFERLRDDKKRWGKPLAALLGAYEAQIRLGLASIGGKDSMSGSFNEIDVPPTLVSFAVDVAKYQDIISDEFKEAGNLIVRFPMKRDEYDLPDYEDFIGQMNTFTALAGKGYIKSAFAVCGHGIAEAVGKMGFGNHLGAEIFDSVSYRDMFDEGYGDIIAEISEKDLEIIKAGKAVCEIVGKVTESGFAYKTAKLTEEEALNAWTAPLESVFPTATAKKEKTDASKAVIPLYENKHILTSQFKTAKPTVFIPVFPGTNCEYDTLRAFERAGAKVNTCVFKNRNEQDIIDSVEAYVKGIKEAQILMFPGGFSAGDEPDGSGKFIATAFRNEKLKAAVNDLIKQRDGLVLGICNGFQAIIKLGLVPYGEICEIDPDSPTLTRNSIGRHISKSVYTKVVSNKSPWLAKAELGGVYSIPASHGEGRFVANDEWLKKLIANGQVATQYVDVNGNPSFDEDFNPNLSYMAIEGITDATGRILGKMAHSERIGEGVAKNIYGPQDQKIFEAGVEYFK